MSEVVAGYKNISKTCNCSAAVKKVDHKVINLPCSIMIQYSVILILLVPFKQNLQDCAMLIILDWTASLAGICTPKIKLVPTIILLSCMRVHFYLFNYFSLTVYICNNYQEMYAGHTCK